MADKLTSQQRDPYSQHFSTQLQYSSLVPYSLIPHSIYYRFVGLCVCVCLSLCLCVCHQDCDKMAWLRNMALSEAITIDNSARMQHYQKDPNLDPNPVDQIV